MEGEVDEVFTFALGNSSEPVLSTEAGGAVEDVQDGNWSFSEWMLDTALTVNKYYTPLLCLVGTLGNSLSVLVFCMDGKYRTQSASLYLSALAISDTGFLLSLLTLWLEQILPSGGILTFSDYSCSLVMYLGQVTCFLSVYLTVAFSIERFIAVRCPFSRPRICTRAKAKKCVACLTITALFIFSYAWLIAKVIKFPSSSTSSSSDPDLFGNMTGDGNWNETNFQLDNNNDDMERYVCTVPEQYFKVSEIANYIDTVITLIIPFFLITFFNIQIARKVLDLERERKDIVASRGSSGSNPRRSSEVTCHYIAKTNTVHLGVSQNENGNGYLMYKKSIRNSFGRKKKDGEDDNVSMQHLRTPSPSSKCVHTSPEVRIAKLLLLVSTVFLLLNLPSHVIRCAQFIQSVTGSQEGNHFLRALQPWSHILFNTSFAVNFLLYCLSGRNFRSSLHNLFLRMWRRNHLHNHYQHAQHHHHQHHLQHEQLIKGSLNNTTSDESSARCATGAYLRIDLGTTTTVLRTMEKSYTSSCLDLMNSESDQIVPV